MGPPTHSTLSRSSIRTKNTIIEIMGNSPSTKKIGYYFIRREVGSTRYVGKSQTTQEQVEGTIH